LVTTDERQPGAVISGRFVIGIDLIEIRRVRVLQFQRINRLAAYLAYESFQLERKIISLARPVEVSARRARKFAKHPQVSVRADAEHIKSCACSRVVCFLESFDHSLCSRRLKRRVAISDHDNGTLFL